LPVEQSAQIEAPEAFDPSSFRSHPIAPGIRIIIAKRTVDGPTETQAIRFDADQGWTLTRAKRWTKRHGYTPRKWGEASLALPTRNACKAANPPDALNELLSLVGIQVVEAQIAASNAFDRITEYRYPRVGSRPLPPGIWDAVQSLDAAARRARETIDTATHPPGRNPDDSAARLHVTEAAAHLREARAALDATNPAPAITPGAIVAAGVATHALTSAPNPPKPRQLVQIGFIRGLEFANGRLMSWSVRERWPLLADPGAEKGSAGRTRLYTLAGGNAASDHDPHKSSTRTFETWHDFDPRRTYTLDVPLSDEFGTALGDVVSIVYRSDKWQAGRFVDYQHEFSRPYPRADAVGTREQPRAIQLSGGRFRLTARGLVG